MRTEQDTKEQAHQALQEMLPWFVNETLPDEQMAQVDAHLRGCAHCRRDVEFERALAGAAPAAPDGVDMERALARMMPRLPSRAAPSRPAGALQRLFSGRRWMPWALAGQGAAIAALALIAVKPAAPEGEYHVLGAAVQGGATMVVAFKPGATLDDLQRLARANGARIVDGPTVTGAYVLQVGAARQAEVAAAFTADPAVLLADPLARGDGQ